MSDVNARQQNTANALFSARLSSLPAWKYYHRV